MNILHFVTVSLTGIWFVQSDSQTQHKHNTSMEMDYHFLFLQVLYMSNNKVDDWEEVKQLVKSFNWSQKCYIICLIWQILLDKL